MMKSLFFISAYAALSSASPVPYQYTFDQIPATEKLVWYPCQGSFFCAQLKVPLDYASKSGPKAYVPLIKIAANTTSTPSKGMVIFNPGGPGGSGVDTILQSGLQLQNIIGTNYDLVSFDPRGVARSIPSGNCLSNYTQSRAQAPPSKRSVTVPQQADTFLIDALAQGAGVAAVCGARVGGLDKAGPYMTASVNARDMLSIVDAYQNATGKAGTGVLNYWGASYGSYLGQTFASLYPTRVGKFVLDGVIDFEDWSSGTDDKLVIHSDEAVNSFYSTCFAGGKSQCPFYTGSSLKDIEQRMQNIFTRLNATNAYLHGWQNASTIQYGLSNLKSIMFGQTYYPIQSFPVLANQLVAFEQLLASNFTTAGVDAIVGPNTSGIAPEWTAEILCSDQLNHTVTPAMVQKFRKQSAYAGEWVVAKLAVCSVWPILAKNRFAGPSGGSPSTPILFVSNTIDPITPIENGRSMSAKYRNSQFLTVQGVGHTSLSQFNACAFGRINAYFQTGSMGATTATCAGTRQPFDGKGAQIL